MGYELEWVELPPEVDVLRRASDDTLWDDGSGYPTDVDDRYAAAAEPYTLELNIWAMGECRARMKQFGMVVDTEHVRPEDAAFDDPSERERDARWRAQRVQDSDLIPLFKLSSNDAWLVHADEIKGALRAYERVPAADRMAAEEDALWARWLDWLRTTQHHGGFFVY